MKRAEILAMAPKLWRPNTVIKVDKVGIGVVVGSGPPRECPSAQVRPGADHQDLGGGEALGERKERNDTRSVALTPRGAQRSVVGREQLVLVAHHVDDGAQPAKD